MDIEKSLKKEILRSIKKHLEWETIGVEKGEEIKPEQILKVLNDLTVMWDGKGTNDAPAGGLSKHDVNQQRELLAAFKEDYNKRNFEDAQIIDQDIELFLAANSG